MSNLRQTFKSYNPTGCLKNWAQGTLLFQKQFSSLHYALIIYLLVIHERVKKIWPWDHLKSSLSIWQIFWQGTPLGIFFLNVYMLCLVLFLYFAEKIWKLKSLSRVVIENKMKLAICLGVGFIPLYFDQHFVVLAVNITSNSVINKRKIDRGG